MTPEYMTISEAREDLEVSKGKMSKLVKDGILKTIPDPLDSRVKLVKREDVERLKIRAKK